MGTVTLDGVTYSGTTTTCSLCLRPFGYGVGYCQCGTRFVTTTGAGWLAAEEEADPPGILSDIPAMRERAERVRARAAHKDLDGPTARLLACDVLALCEALEELG